MTKKELLDNPVFQRASPDALLWYVRHRHSNEQEIHGFGEFSQYQEKGEIHFKWEYAIPAFTKQQLLENSRFKRAKADDELVFCTSCSCYVSFQVQVCQDKAGDIFLLDSFIDQDGTRVYL